MEEFLWGEAAKNLVLLPGEIHLWRTFQSYAKDAEIFFEGLLSSDELKRAHRYHFSDDRRAYTASRAMMRSVLGAYCRVDPVYLKFRYNSYGKPSLTNEFSYSQISFNLAHSNGLALLAVSTIPLLGVDVELVRDELDYPMIAEQFFSPREKAALREIPAAQQRAAFFHGWTRKEAFIKAVGEGLSYPLDQFDVSLGPHEPARLLATLRHPEEAQHWQMVSLSPASGYIAAVAARGVIAKLKTWQWQP